MTFNDFQNKLRPLLVFSSEDIKMIEPRFNLSNLTTWQDKRYIIKISKGYYTFSDYEMNSDMKYVAANKIDLHSYVSCESALAYYKLLDLEEEIKSVSSKCFKTIQSDDYGLFKYHYYSNANYFKGYVYKIHYDNYFRIATPEKAILDFFYFNPKYNTLRKIKDLGFDLEIVRAKVDLGLLYHMLYDYKNYNLSERIRFFEKMLARK